MQKKLLAVAVAGALAAPVAAIAQTSVTIYGTLSASIDTRSATGADSQATPAALGSSIRGTAATTPVGFTNASGAYSTGPANLATRWQTQSAGSNFGLRVREDLGGGMYAWAQMEVAIQMGGYSNPSQAAGGSHLTYRNTGVALGSKAWGDIVFGGWDTPFNINMNAAPQHAPYGNASTSFSAQFFGGNPMYPGTVSNFDVTAVCNAGGGTFTGYTAATCMGSGMSFHRRLPNGIQYWSPNWGGFQFKLHLGTQHMMQSDAVVAPGGAQPSKLKPSAWSSSLTYSAGPLYVGLGYEKHKDYVGIAARTFTGAGAGTGMYLGGQGTSTAVISTGTTGITGSDATGWNLNGRYTFGAFTIGAYYERLKWSMSYQIPIAGDTTELKKTAWGLEGAFVTGPHTLGIRYAKSKDIEGSLAGGNSFDGSASGATGWIFGYGYSLSKRTSVFGYHVRISNDSNARLTGIVFGGLAPAPGGDPRYTGVGVRHAF